MQVTETLSDGLKRAYTVVVPAADLEGRRAARLAELGRTLRLPGFRPGKVPLPLVRQRYGQAVLAEVLEESVNEATRRVMNERGLRPAMQPKVDVLHGEQGRDLEFKVEVEVLPEIAPPDFAAIALTRYKAEPAETAIADALQRIAARQRSFEAIEPPRPAAKGEFLTVDYVGRVEGTEFPGGSGTDIEIEVAGGGFIPGFTEQLEGLAPGETRLLAVSFPEDYPAKEVAGKAAEFTVTAKRLRQAVVPPIDEALASKLGFDTLAELRETVGTQMQREYDQLSRLRLKRQLLDALAGQAGFAAPEGMVEAEFAQIWQRIEADRSAGKLDPDDQDKDEATLRTEYRAIAERRVRLGLLLAEIGRLNGITVGNEELTRAMRAEAGRYPGQEAQVLDFFRKNPQMVDTLRGPLLEDKVIDFILGKATVEDKEIGAEELAREPEESAG